MCERYQLCGFQLIVTVSHVIRPGGTRCESTTGCQLVGTCLVSENKLENVIKSSITISLLHCINMNSNYV